MFSIRANHRVRLAVIGLLVALLLLLAPVCFLFADSGGRSSATAQDSVDLIEVNHFVNSSGESQLDQVIFYDWSPSQSRYIVRAWRSLKTLHQLPMKAPGGGYLSTWHDARDGNVMRVVHSRSVIETWTDYDPEQTNQEYLDRNLRRELSKREAFRWAAVRARRDCR